MAERHKILNDAVKNQFKDGIDFIELTDLIENDEDYIECINHLSRRVYARLANRVIDIANRKLGKDYLSLKGSLGVL